MNIRHKERKYCSVTSTSPISSTSTSNTSTDVVTTDTSEREREQRRLQKIRDTDLFFSVMCRERLESSPVTEHPQGHVEVDSR